MPRGHAVRNDGDSSHLILLVDDDVLLAELQSQWLLAEGYRVRTLEDGESCLAALAELLPDAVCLDLVMPGLSGLETLRRIKEHHPRLPVIVMTAHSEVSAAVEAMKLGAYDFLAKPVERAKLATVLANAVERSTMSVRLAQLEREVGGGGYPGIVGTSAAMRALYGRLDRIAPTDITVLILGESGTGKELVAQAIHEQSLRREQPIVAVSCAAIPESLQESELFGHEKGAFTGATARRIGCFERAHGGTLFLDEIGELSPAVQAKLLRVLQERVFARVGGSVEVRSDFRLIAATHRDLSREVEAGRFREDLFYRIAVMELEVPPLRHRPDDIPLLARHFLSGLAPARVGSVELSADTIDVLLRYSWPGNVRELRNAIERGAVECEDGIVRPADLPKRVSASAGGVAPRPSSPPADTAASREPATAADRRMARDEVPRTLEDIERRAITEALARHNGNMMNVVRELGIGRTTLYRKLKKYDLR